VTPKLALPDVPPIAIEVMVPQVLLASTGVAPVKVGSAMNMVSVLAKLNWVYKDSFALYQDYM
jgi:hypothetical protein